jgi:hypothetical protein
MFARGGLGRWRKSAVGVAQFIDHGNRADFDAGNGSLVLARPVGFPLNVLVGLGFTMQGVERRLWELNL